MGSILSSLLSASPCITGRGPGPTLAFPPDFTSLPGGHSALSCNLHNLPTPHHLVLFAHPTLFPRLQEIARDFVGLFPCRGNQQVHQYLLRLPPHDHLVVVINVQWDVGSFSLHVRSGALLLMFFSINHVRTLKTCSTWVVFVFYLFW